MTSNRFNARSNGANPPGAYPRLTQPLVRENGVLRPATWDEALDRAADGFRRNLAEHGRTRPESSAARSRPTR